MRGRFASLFLGLFLTFNSFVSISQGSDLDEHWKLAGFEFHQIGKILHEEICYQSEVTFFACVAAVNALAQKSELQAEFVPVLMDEESTDEILQSFDSVALARKQDHESVVWASSSFRIEHRFDEHWYKAYTSRESKVPFYEVTLYLSKHLSSSEQESLAVGYALNSWYAVQYDPHTLAVPTNYITELESNAAPAVPRKEEGFVSKYNHRNVAYIPVHQINDDGCERVSERLQQLSVNSVDSAILDLRNVEGGVLDAAVCMADLFLQKDQIVTRKTGPYGIAPDLEWRSENPAKFEGALVVLVNGSTSGMSEVVAASIQDNGRGFILGEQSNGSGAVKIQSEYHSGGLQFFRTVHNYRRVSGANIQFQGVNPDFVIPLVAGQWERPVRQKRYYTVSPDVVDTPAKLEPVISKVEVCLVREGEAWGNWTESEGNADYQLLKAYDVIHCFHRVKENSETPQGPRTQPQWRPH